MVPLLVIGSVSETGMQLDVVAGVLSLVCLQTAASAL